MSTLKPGALIQKIRHLAPRCSAIPGLMKARQDVDRAHAELRQVAALAREAGGLVPRSEKDFHPDVMGNLWFMRAVHEFGAATAKLSHKQDKSHGEFFDTVLLPLCKRIVQDFISHHGIDAVRMDDGGVLAGGIAQGQTLRINALWYAAVQATATALQSGQGGGGGGGNHDVSSGHFERLAGRFRRSFQKAFWCDEHRCICSPAARAVAGHGKLVDPDQLLLTMLPASPLPRTKQRQILTKITQNSLGSLGVRLDHGELGIVESPLHRAWLAHGLAMDQGNGMAAAAMVQPLVALRPAAKKMEVYLFYKDGHPVTAHQKPDALASAEILGALTQFLGD